MWNQLASYKNHYLQKTCQKLRSEHINELVHSEFAILTHCRDKCHFNIAEDCHYLQYYADDADCKHSTYFEDHAKLAYGFWALPKLLREMCKDDKKTRWRAINSLSEYLMNPLHAQRAIAEMDIVRRVYNVFMNVRTAITDNECLSQQADPRELDRIMHIFYILSLYLNGAQKMVRKQFLLDELYKMILNDEPYSIQAGKVLQNFTEKTEIVLYMLKCTNALFKLKDIYERDPLRPHYDEALWQHLSHFLEIAPERGIELKFFDLLHKRIMCRMPRYHDWNMKCFALLLSCGLGQERFDDIDGVLMLYNIFKETQSGLDKYEYVLLALINGLNSKKALWRCHEFTELPLFVLDCTKSKRRQTINLQLYVLQAFKQLSVMPCVKKFIAEHCLKTIKRLKCLSELNECIRDELADWLTRKIYNSDSRAEGLAAEYSTLEETLSN